MMRVAPFASVKSVSAHIELHTVGGCGFGIGMSWSSAWIGCAVSPGRIVDRRQRRDQAARVEHAFDDRQHVLGARERCSQSVVEREQVVDAQRVVALERVRRRARTSKNRSRRSRSLVQRVDELGLDRVLDDRVALLGDASTCARCSVRRPSPADYFRAMALYALGDIVPQIDPDAFVHPDATIIGNVVIGAGVDDLAAGGAARRPEPHRDRRAHVGAGRRGAALHTRELETIVGDDCTIGHLAHLEGCTVEDGALVGTGSIVLHRAIVRSGALVGAGAVVPERHGGARAARWRSACRRSCASTR